jgi:predicted transcriptional regulator
MDQKKARKLRAAGWRIGNTAEFLGLSRAEAALVEMRVSLGHALRESRTALGLSQTVVAGLLRSSQSRVAKMEAADPTVSIDLLLRAMLALGATHQDLARAIQPRRRRAA